MELNRRNVRMILFIIALSVAWMVALFHIGAVVSAICSVLRIGSFLYMGFALAFILNTPMRRIEETLTTRAHSARHTAFPKAVRPVSLCLSALLFLSLVFLVIFWILPELVRSIALLAEQLPSFLAELNDFFLGLSETSDRSLATLALPVIDWVELFDSALSSLSDSLGSLVTVALGAAAGVLSAALNLLLGFVLALYMLMRKEKLIGQTKRLFYAFLPEKAVDTLTDIARLISETFFSFIGGQFTESVLLGFLCFIGMQLFRFPYAAMVSVLVCVTAFIPFFGAMIALIVGVLLILVSQSLYRALWFAAFFFCLQQIENNLIYPHIVGKSVMLSGFWVLIAVTLGGKVAGLPGILLSVPLCSVLYALTREIVNWRNKIRKVSEEKMKI